MRDVTVDQRRAYIGAHTAGYCRPLVVKVTSRPSMTMNNSSLVTMLVALYVSLVSAEQVYCSMAVQQGQVVMSSGTPGTWKVQVRVTVKVKGPKAMSSTRPEQQRLGAETELGVSHPGEDLCLVLCSCGLACLLLGYGAGVIEMLLMMSGDVEPNPGPQVLGPNDLMKVVTELFPVCADWHDIGLALNLTPAALNAIETPNKAPKHCLRDMLMEWLNTPEPSWEGLVQALRNPFVGHQELADRLEAKFRPQETSGPPKGLDSGLPHTGGVAVNNESGRSGDVPPMDVTTQPSKTSQINPPLPSPTGPSSQPPPPADSLSNPPAPSLMSQVLTVSDLPALMTVLGNAAHYTSALGTQLGIDPRRVDALNWEARGDSKEFLRRVLQERLLQKSPTLTFQALLGVISEPPVGDEDLAWRLRQHFMSDDQLVAQSQTAERIEKLIADFESLVEVALQVGKQQDHSRLQRIPLQLKGFGWKPDPREKLAATIKRMWKELAQGYYWDYFNYGLLKQVVLQFDDKQKNDLEKEIERYVSELDDFKEAAKLSEFVQEFRPRQDSVPYTASLKKLEVKITQTGWTLRQVEEWKTTLISKQTIPTFSLILEKICTVDDCSCLTWLVSSSAATEMGAALLDAPCDFFRDNRIIEVTFDPNGQIYYTAKMEPLTEEFCMMYETQVPEFHAQQWPPPPTHKVFNLAMVRSTDTIQSKQLNVEQLRFIMEGNVSSVVKGKATVQLENLLEKDHSKRKVVLIEGAPGAGKSTLAWHICQKWRDKEVFQESQIVIYVQLRDPGIQSAVSLEDLLPLDSEKAEELLDNIKACKGRRVLFVLDGWDEFEPGLLKDSLFHKLICSPYKLNLHYSTLLITSRPIASRELQRYASSRVEILGFLPGEVNQYFEEALGDPQEVQNLQEQLEERPVVEASCYLPLNAAIVVHLFKELSFTLPKTLHGVFSAVVCGCIRRYLKRQSEEEVEIPSLNELPSVVQKEVKCLCSLAYEGSMENKVTFSGQEMESHGLSATQDVLDLMQVVQSFANRNSKLCHFLHLSVQELLTALQISKLSPSEQVRIFDEMFNNPRFAAVFRFYAALTELQTEGIRGIIARIAQSEEEQPFLNLMDCLYEAQSAFLCCFVASQLNGKLELDQVTLSPLNCLSIGYFLSCLCQYPSGHLTVDFTKLSLDCNNIRFLTKGLSNKQYGSLSVEDSTGGVIVKNIQDEDILNHVFQCLETNESVVELDLDHCNLKLSEGSSLQMVDMLSKNSSLRELNLAGNRIGLQYIANGLTHNCGLEKLSLAGCSLRITEDNGSLLEEMLSENKSLKELNLSENSIHAIGLGHIVRGLRRNTSIVKLSLHSCSLMVTEDNGPLLEEMLNEKKTLKELDLGMNSIGAIGLRYIAKGLARAIISHNAGLVKLSLCQCSLKVTEDNGPLLEEMLRGNESLKELDLGFNSIGPLGLRYIATGLSHNTELANLSLYKCSLEVTEDNGPLLEEMLSENTSLKELTLRLNTIGAIGLRYIAKGLIHNTGLVKLSLWHCSLKVTEDNGLPLEEMLKRNSTLEELNLHGNVGITNEGLVALGKGLGANRGLRTIDLSGLHDVTGNAWKQFMLCMKDNHLTRLNTHRLGTVHGETELHVVNEARGQHGLPLLEVI